MWAETTHRGASTASSSTSPGEGNDMQLIPRFTHSHINLYQPQYQLLQHTKIMVKAKYVCCVILNEKQVEEGSGAQWGARTLCLELWSLFLMRGVSWSSSTSPLPNQPPVPMCKPKWQSSNFQLHPKSPFFPAKSAHKVRHAAGKERPVTWQLLSRVEISPEKHDFLLSRHPSIFAIKP